MPHVTSLHIYPIKSCAGIAVQSMELDDRGPVEDRRWMVVDEEGVFQTQREFPRLALVQVQLTPDGVRLAAPGMPDLAVERPRDSGGDFVTHVWDDEVLVRPASPQASVWFSDYLASGVRLVHQPDGAHRVMRTEYAGGIRERRRVSLSDGAPLLLTGTASLDALNRRLTTPLPMNRFRPNVVTTGAGPFAEDSWRTIRVGTVLFEVAKPCARCVTTTVDQSTGTKGVEPLRTLATFRKQGSGVMFGQNIAHHAPGTIHVADALEVIASTNRY